MAKRLQHALCETRNQNQKDFPRQKSLQSLNLLRSYFLTILKSSYFSHRSINDSMVCGLEMKIKSLCIYVWKVKSIGKEQKRQQSPMCMCYSTSQEGERLGFLNGENTN